MVISKQLSPNTGTHFIRYLCGSSSRCDSKNKPPGLLPEKRLRPSKEAREDECFSTKGTNKATLGCDEILNEGGRRLDVSRKLLTGTLRNLVVPIRFNDHQSRSLPSVADLDTLFNNDGLSSVAPTGSVWEVFQQSSYGALSVESTVVDWVTVPLNETDYANGNRGLTTKTHDLLVDALNLVDPLIDFGDFDDDNNNVIDAITFLHSGYVSVIDVKYLSSHHLILSISYTHTSYVI